HPFDTRLRFRIDQVDSGFGLSKDQVIQLSKEAIEIWHQGSNRDDLMVYDENARLSIHLIYDQRQQDYDALKKVEKQLLADDAKYQRQVKNLEASHQHLESQQQRLIQQRDQMNSEFQALQQRRRQPNLSAYEHEQIEYEVLALQRKSESFQRELQYLQEQQSSFNMNVSMHQHGLQNHQQNIIQAQQRFPAREFHKGVFMGNQIQVYQFDAEDDLRLTLAHELGHALGLYHHNDPEALMYPVLGKQNLQHFQLRPADKTLLYNR
ncbi:MAG: matrixin family metalloprotease, partial [Acinetobacter sp.]